MTSGNQLISHMSIVADMAMAEGRNIYKNSTGSDRLQDHEKNNKMKKNGKHSTAFRDSTGGRRKEELLAGDHLLRVTHSDVFFD